MGDKSSITESLVTFDLPLSDKLSLEESVALIAKQGYQRVLLGGEILRLDEVLSSSTQPALVAPKSAPGGLPSTRHSLPATSLTVIQDRLRPTDTARSRFIE